MNKEITKEMLVSRIEEFCMMTGYVVPLEELSLEFKTLIVQSIPETLIVDAISEGFSWEQCYELLDGHKSGVDTSIYYNKDLEANQMLQIKLGLVDRRDVSEAINPDLSWMEMESIIKKAKRV